MSLIHLIPMLLGIVITLAVFTAYRLVVLSRSPLNLSGAVLLLTMACASMGYLFQLLLNDLPAVLFWQKIQVLGINFMYPAWLYFVLNLTGNRTKGTPIIIVLLVAFSLMPTVVLNIPSISSWFVTTAGLVQVGPFTILDQKLGWMVWFSTAVAQVEGIAGAVILARQFKRLRPGYRYQYFLLFLTPIIAFAAIWIEISGLSPIAPFSLFNLSIIPICLVVSLAIYDLRVGQETNVLKEKVVDNLQAAVLIINSEQRLVYLNPAAYQLFNLPIDLPKEPHLKEILPQLSTYLSDGDQKKGNPIEVVNIKDFIFGITTSQIRDWKSDVVGQVLLLQNITDRDRMEKTIIERNQEMEHTNRLLSGLAEVNLHIQKTSEISSIYEILDHVFHHLHLACFIALLDPQTNELTINYITSRSGGIDRVEKLLGIRVFGFRAKRNIFQQFYEFFDGEAAEVFLPSLLEKLPLGAFSGHMEDALRIVGINKDTTMATLQLVAGEKKLGLLGIWGQNIYQEDLPALRLFTSQVAWALERTNLYRNEMIRSMGLERTNQLITALAKVTTLMETSPDSSKALAILGDELEKIELHCLMATVAADGEKITFRYTSFTNRIVKLAKRIPNFNLIGYELPKNLWPGTRVVNEGVPVWYQNTISIFGNMFPWVPTDIFKQALTQIGITPQNSLCILPLVVDGRVIGVLPIWGDGILESDTPTLSIFAHQVAEILRKTQNYEEELARANSLARSNAMIIALSNVAAGLETTANLTEVFDTLGEELRKVQVNCMVATLEADQQYLKIEYLSISLEVIALAKKLGAVWPDEIRIPRRLWPTDKAVKDRVPYWDPDPIGNVSKMFPFIPKKVFSKSFEVANMDPYDPVCYLPMISDDNVIGILAVWGPNLQPDDIPGLSVFSNQVATAIKNTTLYHQAQKEIQVRTQAEAKIQAALTEKEVLLKEIHHRVKNNLQVISSLLNLQMAQSTDENSTEGLRESQNRVRAMALIHEKLYQSDDLALIDFSKYLDSLTNSLAQTYRTNSNQINIQVRADKIHLDLDTAIPCGLIVNELVSNSLKYAFPEAKAGNIAVTCTEIQSGNFTLLVQDDGVGLPAGFDVTTCSTLGLKLVSSLVRQIDGDLVVDGKQGTRFEIHFSKS